MINYDWLKTNHDNLSLFTSEMILTPTQFGPMEWKNEVWVEGCWESFFTLIKMDGQGNICCPFHPERGIFLWCIYSWQPFCKHKGRPKSLLRSQSRIFKVLDCWTYPSTACGWVPFYLYFLKGFMYFFLERERKGGKKKGRETFIQPGL